MVSGAVPHTPVLLDEVLEWLDIKPDGTYIDATLGAGGHSAAIAERLKSGKLISLDQDAQALQLAAERLKRIWNDGDAGARRRSRGLRRSCTSWGFPGWTGSWPTWGFRACSLIRPRADFRFARPVRWTCGWTPKDELTADEIVNRWSEKEMADTLYRGAEEHDSRRIARAIVRARPIRDTAHLATVVAGARKQWGRQRLHPATKTFLALRIAVNREMEALGQFLSRTPATMNSRRPLGGVELPLGRRPPGQARISRGRASGDAESADQTRDPAGRDRGVGEPKIAKCETAVRRKSVGDEVEVEGEEQVSGNAVSYGKENRQFAAGAECGAGEVARTLPDGRAGRHHRVCLMMYIYQHFRCIDLSFQLEDLKVKQTQAAALNRELRLEIAALRDPRRIDVIARRQLGLSQPLPTQVQEYDAPAGAEVAARYARSNHE